MLEIKRKETEKTHVKRVAKISPLTAFVQFFFLLQFVSFVGVHLACGC